MKRFLPVVLLLVPCFATAKDLGCSVKAKRLDADTRAMAKVSEGDARKTALDKIGVAGATVSSGGLEMAQVGLDRAEVAARARVAPPMRPPPLGGSSPRRSGPVSVATCSSSRSSMRVTRR